MGAYATSQAIMLYMKRLYKTDSLIFVLLSECFVFKGDLLDLCVDVSLRVYTYL